MRFQSTPPARGATVECTGAFTLTLFQSTPPARGATYRRVRGLRACRVSIHAPRAGGDSLRAASASPTTGFNPRPPRGGRPGTVMLVPVPLQFQSTPPARGAT